MAPRDENYPSADRFDERDAERRWASLRQDTGRYSSADDDRDYGRYVENDEGDSSVRAGSYDQGRTEFGRESDDSRRHGRGYEGYGNFGQGDYGGGRPGWNTEPDHRGKGPKDYVRSDSSIRENISERLRADPDIDASDISVDVRDGHVTFDGSVESRWQRHAVEYMAEHAGARDITNNLRVAAH